jgi:K+-sensing histidine kinase KdpD
VGAVDAGVVTAVVAALAFDIFFTHPYLSARISHRDDLIADALLFVITLSVAVARSREREATAQSGFARANIGALFAGARAVGTGTARTGDDVLGRLAGVVAQACKGDGAAFLSPEGKVIAQWGTVPLFKLSRVPALALNGWPPDEPRRVAPNERWMPAGGVVLPVRWLGDQLGYLALFGADGEILSPEAARTLVVGATLAGGVLSQRDAEVN